MRWPNSGRTFAVFRSKRSSGSRPNLIATCRIANSSEAFAREQLAAAIRRGARYVDIEIEAPDEHLEYVRTLAREYGCWLIVSFHDFEGTPSLDELKGIARLCRTKGADLVKIVTTAWNISDAARTMRLYDLQADGALFEGAAAAERPQLVAFSMGEAGKFTRLLCLKLGAPYTYVSAGASNATASGQYTREEMEQIRDIVKKHDLYLFADEVYREYIYTDEPYTSAMHLEGIENNVILVDSVSKRYSECGIRIGAIITKNTEVRKAVLKFCQARLSPPLMGQIIAEASLEAPESYIEGVQKEYVERRNCLVNGLNQIPGVFSPMPKGAFYTVAKLPVDNAEKFCRWLLEEFSYEGETVMMAPASGFYSTKGAGLDEVRLAYVLCCDELRKALVCLEKGLEAYPGRVK